jgi:hypothetical protein
VFICDKNRTALYHNTNRVADKQSLYSKVLTRRLQLNELASSFTDTNHYAPSGTENVRIIAEVTK